MRTIAGILSLTLSLYALSFIDLGNKGWTLQFSRNAGARFDISAWWVLLPLAYGLYCIVLTEVDRLVRRHVFPNRSRAIQEAVGEKVKRLAVNRLARECAKLDPKAEQALAEEGMSGEVASWPEY
jgi:Arc/MetJ-type ribon-helix-helix transcriptional regulator